MGWFNKSDDRRQQIELGFVKCKKHPKFKKLPGVCPSCLSDKLSKISSSSSMGSRRSTRRRALSASSSSSSSSVDIIITPYYCNYSSGSSSAVSSSCEVSSPTTIHHKDYRRNSISFTRTDHTDNDRNHSLSFLINGKDGTLMRSKSVAFVARNWVETDFAVNDNNNLDNKKKIQTKKKKKKRGFWSKFLLGPSSLGTNISSLRKKKDEKLGLMHSKTLKETRNHIAFF